MEGSPNPHPIPQVPHQPACLDESHPVPFAQQLVTITKQAHIELRQRANYFEAQLIRAQQRVKDLEQKLVLKDAKIKDLRNRLFGKKSEKGNGTRAKSEKDHSDSHTDRKRGQQSGSRGHGRTQRANLPIVHDEIDLAEDDKKCRTCGLPYCRNPGLDEQSDVIEVEVQAYTRRYHRPAYIRNPGCRCEQTPTIITAPPPPRLIPRSPYGVSFWVDVMLSKFRYGQPINRALQDLNDQGLPVSPGTVAGGLQRLAALFEPVRKALHAKQMSEVLFHNDETRWEVFVAIEGKVGTRWYLWVTRSTSVVYYCIDPSRSAAVPGAHFAGLQHNKVIIVCDRYSAYKKLARLMVNILLAFCWAHVRRDFLDAGRAFSELDAWALEWKERIGTLYHLNKRRLEHWDSERSLTEQSDAFNQYHEALKETLQRMQEDATRVVNADAGGAQTDPRVAGESESTAAENLSKSAHTKVKKVFKSLLNHWAGLTLFVANPQVPMDNNLGEQSIRHPVTGRKNYYGSGSIWSALLTATLFSILQTLGLWGINPRCWMMLFLTACAENGGKVPKNIDPFLPWLMDDARRAELTRPYPSHAPPDQSTEQLPIYDNS